MIVLRIVRGLGAGREEELPDGVTLVGRTAEKAQIVISSKDISREHLRLTVKQGHGTVENVGKNGSLLNGQPLQGVVPIADGMEIALPNGSVLRFTLSSSRSGEAIQSDDPTRYIGSNPTGATVSQHTGYYPAPSAGTFPNADPIGQPPIRTVPVTRVWDNTSSATTLSGMGRASGLILAVLILAGLVALAGWGLKKVFVGESDEETIVWPQDRNGTWLEDRFYYPSSNDWDLALILPRTPAPVVEYPESGKMIARCGLGRAGNIPLTFTLTEKQDSHFLSMDEQSVVEEWVSEVSNGPDTWILNEQTGYPLFLGKEQGIPCKRVFYQRHAADPVFGVAWLFRQGRIRYVVTLEIPAQYKVRLEEFLSITYLTPSDRFLRQWWQGSASASPLNSDQLMAQCRRDAQRNAPSGWKDAEAILMETIRKAALENNAPNEKEAMDLLLSLRERQAVWFNHQVLRKMAAANQGDTEAARMVKETCMGIFSDSRDQRYHEIRKWAIP